MLTSLDVSRDFLGGRAGGVALGKGIRDSPAMCGREVYLLGVICRLELARCVCVCVHGGSMLDVIDKLAHIQ